jgi:uncharacterized repeat protein (TIGR01451 family)
MMQQQTFCRYITRSSAGDGLNVRIPQKRFARLTLLLKAVLCTLMFLLLGSGFATAAEIDDSSLFVEAFNAYQKNDYLLAIEKIEAIDQLFPDTPLRDVALLLLARSGIRSGDNELAATAINRFTSEFAASPLKSTIEEELLRLGTRRQKGEKLPPAIPLRTAARKVRTEQLALERSTAHSAGPDDLSKAGPGQSRVAAAKTGAEESEQERLKAQQQQPEQETVRAAINLSGTSQTSAVGQRGEIPFEVANLGSSAANFVLETTAPADYQTSLIVAGRTVERFAQLSIGTATPLKGSILYRIPPDRVDGYKAAVSLRALSERHHRIVAERGTQVIASAPLVRVVAKPDKQRPAPGERVRYHITVLNVGSLAARELSVRVFLPPQLVVPGEGTATYTREVGDSIAFRVGALDTGKLVEFAFDAIVRNDSPPGQELRSRIEVVNSQLQTKEHFTSAAAIVEGPRTPDPQVDRTLQQPDQHHL